MDTLDDLVIHFLDEYEGLRRLVAFVYRRLPGGLDANDVIQESFMRLYAEYLVPPPSRISTWPECRTVLVRIIRNYITDLGRQVGVKKRAWDILALKADAKQNSITESSFEPLPDEIRKCRELHEQAVGSMSPRQQWALRYWLENVGRPEGSKNEKQRYSNYLFQGLEELRKAWIPHQDLFYSVPLTTHREILPEILNEVVAAPDRMNHE